MWEFRIEKELSQRWIWTRSANGRTFQRSPGTYQSFGAALDNAMLYGFDATEHKFRLNDLPGLQG